MKVIYVIILFIVIQVAFSAKSPYKTLGLSRYATMSQVKEAYKKYVKEYHPDRYQNSDNLEEIKLKMTEINEAYDAIKRNGFKSFDEEDYFESEEATLIMRLLKVVVIGVICFSIKFCINKFFFIYKFLVNKLCMAVAYSLILSNLIRLFGAHLFTDNLIFNKHLLFYLVLIGNIMIIVMYETSKSVYRKLINLK